MPTKMVKVSKRRKANDSPSKKGKNKSIPSMIIFFRYVSFVDGYRKQKQLAELIRQTTPTIAYTIG